MTARGKTNRTGHKIPESTRTRSYLLLSFFFRNTRVLLQVNFIDKLIKTDENKTKITATAVTATTPTTATIKSLFENRSKPCLIIGSLSNGSGYYVGISRFWCVTINYACYGWPNWLIDGSLEGICSPLNVFFKKSLNHSTPLRSDSTFFRFQLENYDVTCQSSRSRSVCMYKYRTFFRRRKFFIVC